VLALLAVRLVDEFAGFLPQGTFESFRADLGLTYTQASVVLVAAAPGAILGNGFAVLADFRSRRVIAAGGAFGFAAALATFGLSHSFLVIVVASVVLGCASSAMCDATEVALVDLAGAEPASQISRSFLFGAVGDLLAPALLIAAAAAGVSWRITFAVGAATCAIYGVWLASCRFPPPPPRVHGESVRNALGPIIRDRRVWYFGALALLLGPLDEDTFAFLLAYLQRDVGVSSAVATAIASASIVGALVGFVTTSRRGYRPPARALRSEAIVIAVSLIAAVVVGNLAVLAMAELVFGFAVARYWIALKTQIVQLNPQRVGSVNAVVSTIEFSGFLLPVLAGRLADTFGVRAGFGFSAVIAVVTVGLIVAFDDRVQARSARAI
jgi:predicted MFS family arabinose efflux permease